MSKEAKFEENCELRGTDNVQRQRWEHIFAPNRGCRVYYPSNILRWARCFWKLRQTDSRPIYHWQSTNIPPTVDRYSTDSQWLTYRPSVSRYIDRDIDRDSIDISTDITAGISTVISTDISQSICRLSAGWYDDRHIRWVLVNMSTDTQPIHWSRGAQNTHDPTIM